MHESEKDLKPKPWWTSLYKYLVPQLSSGNVRALCSFSVMGACIAGLYGVIHDAATFSISPEYFTKLKFQQFHYLDFGWGDHWMACSIGFVACWWVGLIVGWFLARKFVPDQPEPLARRNIVAGFGIVFACVVLSGLIGFGYGLWRGPDADYSLWTPILAQRNIQDHWSFVRVAYIHNAGYIGGLSGLLIALFTIRRLKSE